MWLLHKGQGRDAQRGKGGTVRLRTKCIRVCKGGTLSMGEMFKSVACRRHARVYEGGVARLRVARGGR